MTSRIVYCAFQLEVCMNTGTYFRLSLILVSVAFLMEPEVVVAQIQTPPSSSSALYNSSGCFYCDGVGLGIRWRVNGAYVTTDQYMIDTDSNYDFTNWNSTICIPALERNNNITIQCVIVLLSKNDFSQVSYLFVLGIGSVPGLHFNNRSLCVEWKKPYASNDVLDVKYNISLTGGKLSLKDTTDLTVYCLIPYTTPCKMYKMTVTPFSSAPDYTGQDTSNTMKVTGGDYSWDGPCAVQVIFVSDRLAGVVLTCKMMASSVTCPGQTVLALCSSYTNSSGTSIEFGPKPIETLLLSQEKSIEISIPRLPVSEKLFCDVTLIGVDSSDSLKMRQDFDTYSAKGINISAEETSTGVLVTVVVTYEATTPLWGFLVSFESLSLEKFSLIVERVHGGSAVSSHTIAKNPLTRGTTYMANASVYDCATYNCSTQSMEPALKKPLALIISLPPKQNSNESIPFADSTTSTNTSALYTSSSEVLALHVVVVLLSLLLLVVVGFITIVAVRRRWKSKQKQEENCLQERSRGSSEEFAGRTEEGPSKENESSPDEMTEVSVQLRNPNESCDPDNSATLLH